MAVEEFSLIERYFKDSQAFRKTADVDKNIGVDTGIGDDAAILTPPAGKRLCVAVDTLVSGRHFPSNTSAYDVGYKALAVNLSDLAAMGASPYAFTLALTLPDTDKHWLQGFSEGLFQLAEQYQIALIGGDTTRGPLTISIQIIGLLPHGQALLRSGAQAGDDIYVSGNIGDAGLGLKLQQDQRAPATPSYKQHLISRLNRPSPRIELGQALLGLANSAIDVSDGLLVDLKHILDASQVGASIMLEAIPLSSAYLALSNDNTPPLQTFINAVEAGDDYELCFSAAKNKRDQIKALKKRFPITRIGEISQEKTLQCIDAKGKKLDYRPLGFEHFS
ncbi:MAG: thiamine-phosphate kinase [Pseudomonadales bacterium]|nr:thiamine-phosphate kinase [Pseudomonadales bacterium]